MGNKSGKPATTLPRAGDSIQPQPPSIAPRLPLTSVSSTPTTFSLFLVRHGVSCANLKKAKGQSFTDYLDPELTRAGQQKALVRGALFRKYLTDRNIRNPIVGASALLRAQQTAYLMMGGQMKDIFLVPYASEMGSAFWFRTKDNMPMLPQEKARLLKIPQKSSSLDLSVLRYPEPLPPKYDVPDIKKFKTWLGQNYLALAHLHGRNNPPLTSENEEHYETLQTRRTQLAERKGALQAAASGPRAQAALQRIQLNEEQTDANIEALNERRQAANNVSQNPAFILFTHGNFITNFIKALGGAVAERPNYSAFEFSVTLRPNAAPEIRYVGPVKYDYGVDADPSSPYEATTRIDADKECEKGGDQCRIRVCGPSRLNVFRGRRNETRRARPPVQPPQKLVLDYPAPPPAIRRSASNNNEKEGNVTFYNTQEGGARRTRKRRVRFASKTHKSRL